MPATSSLSQRRVHVIVTGENKYTKDAQDARHIENVTAFTRIAVCNPNSKFTVVSDNVTVPESII